MVSAFGGAQDYPALDLRSIPISDWLDAGEHADVPWDFGVRDAYLRIDQRLEISYLARIDAKDLNRTGKTHELFLITRISTPDGEWLNEASIERHTIEDELPRRVQIEFFKRAAVGPPFAAAGGV